MRRQTGLLALLVSLGVGIACLPAHAAAKGGVLPKGFAYAAEIQATINYDGTYHRGSETDVPCSDGVNEVTLASTETDTLHFDRTVYFSHITVPVVKLGELGKAAARLGLSPTATSPGKFRSDRSTMDFEANLPDGDPASEGCHTKPVNCHWGVQGAPVGSFQTISSRGDGFLPISWFISVLGTNSFIEEDCPIATGTEELDTQLHQADTLYTTIDVGSFPEVAIDRDKLGDFRELRHRTTVSFVQDLSGGSNTDCRGEEGATRCAQSVTGTARIKLRRIGLYRTKRAYAK
jgi:hypothetical protein